MLFFSTPQQTIGTILIFIAGLAALASLVICVVSIYKSDTQKSAYFNLLAMAVTFYMIGNFLEFTSDSVEAAFVGIQISYLGIPFIPPLWYLCVREYCGIKVQNTWTVLGIMLVPVAIVILAYTWRMNHLLFTNFLYESGNHVSQMQLVQGPLYIIKELYLYLFNILGIITIARHYIKGTKKFREQAIFFFISSLIPVFTTATYLVEINTYWVDITSILLSITIVLFFFALQKYGINNLSSILKDNLVDNLRDGILLFDKNGIYMDANKATKEIFPEATEVALGTTISDMSYLPFDISVLNDDESTTKEFYKEYDDHIRTYSLSVAHVKRKQATLGHSISISNITPLKNMMSELEIKAHIDPLTNIYNRGFFFEKSMYEAENAKLAKNHLSLIMFDLDFFKNINDSYGHAYGDYVLKTVALIGQQNLRSTDIFARYGGEEFCILLPNTHLEGARLKAEVLRKKISAHLFDHEGVIIGVTASFGVAAFNHTSDKNTLNEVIKQADENMYKAKAEGRNRVVQSMPSKHIV